MSEHCTPCEIHSRRNGVSYESVEKQAQSARIHIRIFFVGQSLKTGLFVNELCMGQIRYGCVHLTYQFAVKGCNSD